MKLLKKIWQELHKTDVKILSALITILVALSVITFLTNKYSIRAANSTSEVEKAQEIKFDIQQILSVSTDLETGSRGYVITGNEKYLEPTNKAIGIIYQHLDHLKTAVNDSKAKINQVIELEDLIDQKISISTRSVEIRREKGLSDASLFIQGGSGQKLMDDIRKITSSMLIEEDAFLNERLKQNKLDLTNFNWAFNLLLLKIGLSVVSVLIVLRLYFRNRKKAEAKIEEANSFLNAILENIPDMIFVKDAKELRFVKFNKAGEKLLGFPQADLIGKNDYDFFPAEQADHFFSKDQAVLRSKEVLDIKEEPIDTKTGNRWLHTKKIVLTDENGNPTYLMGISEDITEQKKLREEEVDRAKQVFDLFNTAPCGYLSTDTSGTVAEINDTLLAWRGYKREQVIGVISTRSLLSDESLKIFAYYFPKLKSGEIKSVHDVEVQFKRKDGSFFPALVNSIGVYDEDGNFTRTRTSIFDISLMKKAEVLLIRN